MPDDQSSYNKVVKTGLKLKGKPLRNGRQTNETTMSNHRSSQVPTASEPKLHPIIINKLERIGKDDNIQSSHDVKLTTETESFSPPPDQPDVIDEDVANIVKMKSMTTAEKTFLIARAKRRKDLIDKRLAMTHRQRMAAFNAQLGKLSEHFDIPKVGPG